MAHKFSVSLPKGLKSLMAGVDRVREGVTAAGGTYVFDAKTNTGTFSMKGVSGSFKVIGTIVHITLTRKPFLVTYGYVEDIIRGHFANGH